MSACCHGHTLEEAHLCGQHDACNPAGVHEAAPRDLGWVQNTHFQQVFHSVLHLHRVGHTRHSPAPSTALHLAKFSSSILLPGRAMYRCCQREDVTSMQR